MRWEKKFLILKYFYNIIYKEDTINIKEELVARLETLNHFKKQYEDLIDENDESKKLNYFSNLKQIFIKNKFEEILEDKIPSCNSSRYYIQFYLEKRLKQWKMTIKTITLKPLDP